MLSWQVEKVLPPNFTRFFPIRDFKSQIEFQIKFHQKFYERTSAGLAALTNVHKRKSIMRKLQRVALSPHLSGRSTEHANREIWPHEWAHESAHENAPRGCPRTFISLFEPFEDSPRKAPRNVPWGHVSTEVPTKLSTKAVSFHMSCFHMFLGWHVCRTKLARNIFFKARIFSRKMLRNFPRIFLAFILWVRKNPTKFPANFPQNFPPQNQKKITDELLQG